jgi:hypothetical protein
VDQVMFESGFFELIRFSEFLCINFSVLRSEDVLVEVEKTNAIVFVGRCRKYA